MAGSRDRSEDQAESRGTHSLSGADPVTDPRVDPGANSVADPSSDQRWATYKCVKHR